MDEVKTTLLFPVNAYLTFDSWYHHLSDFCIENKLKGLFLDFKMNYRKFIYYLAKLGILTYDKNGSYPIEKFNIPKTLLGNTLKDLQDADV